MTKLKFLNNNTLKIIACVSMLIDHIGMILFPQIKIFRILGRIAFPIFAFMISEGFKYTKNKAKYFLTIFILGSIFQIVYIFVVRNFTLNILLTFSVSIMLLYALQEYKRMLFNKKSTTENKIQATFLFIVTYLAFFMLDDVLIFDYGIFGALLPVFASVFTIPKLENSTVNHKTHNIIFYLNLLSFAIGLLILAIYIKGNQYYSLISILPLLLYSGKRGKLKMKYFFYIFYPLHFVILYLISLLC